MKKLKLVLILILSFALLATGCASDKTKVNKKVDVKVTVQKDYSMEVNSEKNLFKISDNSKKSSKKTVVFGDLDPGKKKITVSELDKSGKKVSTGSKTVKVTEGSTAEVKVKTQLLPGDLGLNIKVNNNKAYTVKYQISDKQGELSLSDGEAGTVVKEVSAGSKKLSVSLHNDGSEVSSKSKNIKISPNNKSNITFQFDLDNNNTDDNNDDTNSVDIFSSTSLTNDIGVAKLEWSTSKSVEGFNVYRDGSKVNSELITGRNFYVDKTLTEKANYYYRIEAVRDSKDNIKSSEMQLSSSEMDDIKEFPKFKTVTLEAGETLTYDMNSLHDGEQISFIVTDTGYESFRYDDKSDIPEYNVKIEKYFNGRFYDEPEQRPTDDSSYSKIHEPELDDDYKTKSEWNDTDFSASATASYSTINSTSDQELRASTSSTEDYNDLEGLERNKTGEPIIKRELDVGEKFNMFQVRGGPAEFKVLAKSEHAYFVLQDTFYNDDYDDKEFDFYDHFAGNTNYSDAADAVQSSIDTFENEIFPTVMDNVAEEDWDYYDVNDDGRFMVVFGYLSDNPDSIAGAFHSKDLPYDHPDNPKTRGIEGSYYGENEMDMIYINVQKLIDLREPPYDYESTSTALSWDYLSTQIVAHEFTHWINNYESYKKGMSTDKINEGVDQWMDEGLASLSEYLTGYEKPGNLDRTIESISTANDDSITGWPSDNRFSAYKSKLGFASYIHEKYGKDAISEIAGSENYIESIEDYTGKSFSEVVLDYVTTGFYNNYDLKYNESEFDVYDFKSINLRTSIGSYWSGFDTWKYNQLLEKNIKVKKNNPVSFGFRGNGNPGKVRISANREVKVRIINFNKAK